MWCGLGPPYGLVTASLQRVLTIFYSYTTVVMAFSAVRRNGSRYVYKSLLSYMVEFNTTVHNSNSSEISR